MTAVMALPAQMPGSFLQDNNHALPYARYKVSPFLPPEDDSPCTPVGPSVQSNISTSSHGTTANFDQRYSRKRPRLTTNSSQITSFSTPRSGFVDAISPAPLVNTNYRIAGGLDTPGQQLEDDKEFEYEIDCRPTRYQSRLSRPQSDSYFPRTPARVSSDSNKRRLSTPATPMKGWGKTVWAVTGGIAGKVFNFCWNTTFHGFQAGGGGGYGNELGTPSGNAHWADEKNDVFHSDHMGRHDRESTPVPGGFPDDGPEFIEDYMSKLTVDPEHSTMVRMRRRRQNSPSISRFNSWVVVDGGDSPDRESSPIRKKSRASTANLHAAHSSPALRQASHPLTRPRLTPRLSGGRSSASIASPRTSMGSHLTEEHQPRYTSSHVTPIDTTQHQHRRPSSSQSAHRPSHSRRASSHSLSLAIPQQKQSPQVRKFQEKLRRKEAKQVQKIDCFSEKLEAMIREGQAALGSKIEVEMDSDEELDEGYCEADDMHVDHDKSGRWS